MAKVSIVILNFNGAAYLKKFLPTVIRFSKGHEIVVADNNSSDDSLQLLKSTFPEIRTIIFSENHGFCGGYNKALAQIESNYFVLLNSDIEVTPNWIEPIIDLFDKNENIAAIQPKLLDYNSKTKFEYAGGAGGFIDKYGYPFCRGRIFDSIETDTGQYNDTREIFWATGACLFLRADVFKSFGGFDDDFFAHMEEIDLCWRVKQKGYKVYHCGKSVVYHVGGGTLAYSNPQKTYLNFRNSLLVLIKNLPVGSLVWKVPFRWFLDYIAVIKFVLTGKFKDAAMILKAHYYIVNNLKVTLQKRGKIDHKVQNLTGTYPKLLLFSYHIARVRKFSELYF